MRKLLLFALMLSGLITSAQTSITNGNCKAAFKYAVNDKTMSLIAATAIDFYDRSEGKITYWFWDFGDGNTSTEQNPSFVFNHPLAGPTVKMSPYRTVSLTVLTADSCKSFYSETINIMDGSGYDPKPVECETAFGYSVNYDIKTFAPALVLDFHSKALPEPTEWNWNFDDGTTSNEANPTHIFTFPVGTDSTLSFPNPYRKVCLTVKTVSGCIAMHCETIDIYMKKIPDDEPVSKCQALFKYYKPIDIMTIPEVVAYKLLDVSEGKVIRRLWTFEDGKTSTEAEQLVTFDIFKSTQKVNLTIYTADSCKSSWSEIIYVSNIKPDTIYISKPANKYAMRYEASFPPQMSSCAGWAKAQVYMNDSLVKADNYVWSTGAIGQEVKGLCPTKLYTVKAISPDGTFVTGTFVFNSDGTVTEAPYNWWVTGYRDNPFIKYELDNKDLTVEWRLCDGTIVRSDSIPLNSINCGGNESNLILKDASGNIVYSENISLKTLATGIVPDQAIPSVKLFPNPVNDVLNILYSGKRLNEMQLEICDIAGKRISLQKFYDVESGQQISLNVNELRKGIYFYKMLSNKQVIRTDKFIK